MFSLCLSYFKVRKGSLRKFITKINITLATKILESRLIQLVFAAIWCLERPDKGNRNIRTVVAATEKHAIVGRLHESMRQL